jgi:hypothetical protein
MTLQAPQLPLLAFFGPGQQERIAQHLQQALARLTQELYWFAIDFGLNVNSVRHFSLRKGIYS